MPLCALGTPEPPGSAQRLHARGAHARLSHSARPPGSRSLILHLARSVPCLLWFTSAPRAGTRLAELSFSLQRVPSGSAVRISAPALTLKRPLCLSLILTEERPARWRGRGPTPARIREAASPTRQG